MEVHEAPVFVVQVLVASHKQDGGVVPVLDVETTTRTPEHLVVLANDVADIACSDREYLTPDGEAHPKRTGKRNVPDVIEFLVTATRTKKEHLVDREPPVPIEAHVELGEFAHVVRDTALHVHREGVRRNDGERNCKQDGGQNFFHTANTQTRI